MIKPFGVINNITKKYFTLLDNEFKTKKSLNDSDDEMIIKYKNEIK